MNKNFLIIKNILLKYLQLKNIKIDIIIENSKKKYFGQFSTNLAILLSKRLKIESYIIATEIVDFIHHFYTNLFKNINIIGIGFINFIFNNKQLQNIINDVFKFTYKFGSSKFKNYKYNLEIMSANPTGYLHLGHARNGVIGDSVARILRFAGYKVVTEYYINDSGNQINILTISIFTYYLNLLGKKNIVFNNFYNGKIYIDIAKKFVNKYKDKFINIKYSNNKILDNNVHKLFRYTIVKLFMNIIKKQLKNLRIHINHYISEHSMYNSKLMNIILQKYDKNQALYTKNGAIWLKTTIFGDDKDRVLIKSDKTYTYLMPDLINHIKKYERTNANKLINFWGPDHHSYITRIYAGLLLLNFPKEILEVKIIQIVNYVKNGIEYNMSKRKGTAFWLIDILNLIGVDVIRYILCSQSSSSHIDFDIKKIQKYSKKNPVYYAQYATARCNSIFKQAKIYNINYKKNISFDLLNQDQELNLLNKIDLFNSFVESAAKKREPYLICDYIQIITKQFHSYYNEFKILDLKNLELSEQRLAFVWAIYQVLLNAFNLIGINIMSKM